MWINILNILFSVFTAVKDVILYTHCVPEFMFLYLNTTMNTYYTGTVTLLWFMLSFMLSFILSFMLLFILSFILAAGWVRRRDAEQDRPAQHQECDPEVEPGAPAWRGHHQAGPTTQGQHRSTIYLLLFLLFTFMLFDSSVCCVFCMCSCTTNFHTTLYYIYV